ncbi:hypothetical protein T310_6289 [Rasamsonia emersonii CBS 393.64]|uniref:IBR domain-containing protein n=1 Tax=Rasamsonia emersonii (strain ATCC 16479 / CBS 393.64 / IMI 116815) TaxID=1408163 RepID=A0A0F4YQ22_RASE3|nr:hypothetical protein T310_6289 [Rasamsonia emersonii CBS 393.64]KKA19718.1 hypothetical protein T310_6289 [Rasamsonia emersonii CBS 393.64]
MHVVQESRGAHHWLQPYHVRSAFLQTYQVLEMNTPIRTAADFVSIDVHRCICGAQFCYACGQRWKTCLCPRWNENRLLCQLPVVAGRANNNDGVNDEPDDEDPEEESDEESDNDDESSDSEDDCQHEHWRYIQGRNVCEGCAGGDDSAASQPHVGRFGQYLANMMRATKVPTCLYYARYLLAACNLEFTTQSAVIYTRQNETRVKLSQIMKAAGEVGG